MDQVTMSAGPEQDSGGLSIAVMDILGGGRQLYHSSAARLW